ncbi:TPA: hypothetical protein ACH3X3_010347 [Trebouxia sp. C0006]
MLSLLQHWLGHSAVGGKGPHRSAGEANRLLEEDKSLEALRILQLRRHPKKADVLRIRRRMSSMHHPDKVQGKELRDESTRRFEAIQEAGYMLEQACR